MATKHAGLNATHFELGCSGYKKTATENPIESFDREQIELK